MYHSVNLWFWHREHHFFFFFKWELQRIFQVLSWLVFWGFLVCLFVFFFFATQAVSENSWARDWTYAAQQQPEPQQWECRSLNPLGRQRAPENKLFKCPVEAESQALQPHTFPFQKAHPGSSESLIHCLTKQPPQSISSKHRTGLFCLCPFFSLRGGDGVWNYKRKRHGESKKTDKFFLWIFWNWIFFFFFFELVMYQPLRRKTF